MSKHIIIDIGRVYLWNKEEEYVKLLFDPDVEYIGNYYPDYRDESTYLLNKRLVERRKLCS